MSRNQKLREIASKLPEYPKLTDKGKAQYDSYGKIINHNHFRVLKDIEKELGEKGYGRNSQEVAKQFNKYVQTVLRYDKLRQKKAFYKKDSFWVAIVFTLTWLGYLAYIKLKTFL